MSEFACLSWEDLTWPPKSPNLPFLYYLTAYNSACYIPYKCMRLTWASVSPWWKLIVKSISGQFTPSFLCIVTFHPRFWNRGNFPLKAVKFALHNWNMIFYKFWQPWVKGWGNLNLVLANMLFWFCDQQKYIIQFSKLD